MLRQDSVSTGPRHLDAVVVGPATPGIGRPRRPTRSSGISPTRRPAPANARRVGSPVSSRAVETGPTGPAVRGSRSPHAHHPLHSQGQTGTRGSKRAHHGGARREGGAVARAGSVRGDRDPSVRGANRIRDAGPRPDDGEQHRSASTMPPATTTPSPPRRCRAGRPAARRARRRRTARRRAARRPCRPPRRAGTARAPARSAAPGRRREHQPERHQHAGQPAEAGRRETSSDRARRPPRRPVAATRICAGVQRRSSAR